MDEAGVGIRIVMEASKPPVSCFQWPEWRVRAGTAQGDVIILIGLFLVAAAIWFVQLGGEDGLANALTEFSQALSKLRRMFPW